MTLHSFTLSQLLRGLELVFNSYHTGGFLPDVGIPQPLFFGQPTLLDHKKTNDSLDAYSPISAHSPTPASLTIEDVNRLPQLPKNRFFVEDILGPHFGNRSASDNQTEPSSSSSPSSNNNIQGHAKIYSHAQSTRREQTKREWREVEPMETLGTGITTTAESFSRSSVDLTNSEKPTPIVSPLGRMPLPAWVFCTRYSDRPSSGPRTRKPRRIQQHHQQQQQQQEEANLKRPRTSFTNSQLRRLAKEFEVNRYLDENRRKRLATELDLRESQVKIWFQNKRAKTKKVCSTPDRLALHLMAEGLYNHSVRIKSDTEESSSVSVMAETNSINLF